MAIGIGIGLPFRRNIATTPAVPSGLSASFTVDTISGDLTWTDNSAGKAQYEIYSSTNGGDYALLTTTSVGATSYSDTTCKQNASVVYRIRAKKGTLYSDYVTVAALVTPLCLKTVQTARVDFVFNVLNIDTGGTVNINWGDGSNNNYTGTNSNITHTYAASTVNIFNISLTGNLDKVLSLQHVSNVKTNGSIANYILPENNAVYSFRSTNIEGDISNILVPDKTTILRLYSTRVSGKLPNIITTTSTALEYRIDGCYMTGTNIVVFRTGMSVFNISNQNTVFPTEEIDKVLKNLADWYQINTPISNCTFTMSGTNMGIPTGGITNTDIVRLTGYYTAAGKSATILVRTS